MSETVTITPGSKVKRGGIVTFGEATVEYPDKEKTDKPVSRLVKYQCPDKCLQPEDPNNPGRKLRAAKIWVQTGGDERYAQLLPCSQCGKSLVFVSGQTRDTRR